MGDGTTGISTSTEPLRFQGQQDMLSNYHPLQDSSVLISGHSTPFLIGQQEKGDREKAMHCEWPDIHLKPLLEIFTPMH